ncbi:ABC transporter substrate-binding protein, partial [bacterium]|nr:ABC transporter substrate-binding protein [bacterium]
EAINVESAPEPEPIEETALEVMTFIDGTDTVIEFTEYPQAIVSISPSTTEILFAVGAGEQLAGREDMSLYPEEALDIPSVGALWGELPIETILAMEPDLIVAAQIISEDQVQALR